MSRVAVTGADGFVGRHVCRALIARGAMVRPLACDQECADRFRSFGLNTEAPVIVGDIGVDTDWSAALDAVDAVVHLAARVHVMNETAADPLEAFREVNVRGTQLLARRAAAAGVGRLVFVSSIKVNGESTTGRGPFSERDEPAPEDPYGQSKYEAELALKAIASETSLEVTIIRPPLVHGPGVGGNLLTLMKLVSRGLPLPLGAVRNRRSLIHVENLADVLALCTEHPNAVGAVFTVSDGMDLSTADLVRRLAEGMEKTARLVPVPVLLLKLGLGVFGKAGVYDRLAGDLVIDPSTVMMQLNWEPPVPVDDGLKTMGAWYRRERL